MRYLKAIGLFVFISLLLLFAAFFLYRLGYSRYYASETKELNEKLNGRQYHDILFLGSSRIVFHLNPQVVDSVTGLDSYNAGVEGARFIEMNTVLQAYLHSHPSPKYLIIDIPASAFDPDQRPFYNPNIYFPFLNNEIIYSALKPYQRVYMLKYLPFTQMGEADDATRQAALSGLFGQTNSKPGNFYKGYATNGNDTLKLPFVQLFYNLNVPVYAGYREGIKQIVETCKEKNIQVMVIYPPVYRFTSEKMNPDFFPAVQALCDANKIIFRNYYQIPLTADHRLFRDQVHLNQAGADIFSAVVAKDLMAIFGVDSVKK